MSEPLEARHVGYTTLAGIGAQSAPRGFAVLPMHHHLTTVRGE
ncbi:hypothetical protein ACFQDN_25175 [Pseudomonas asuensis]|nr:hypothetical protein [Pseudomonas asuensis]